MNALVNYASDSESENEEEVTQQQVQDKQHKQQEQLSAEDDYVITALKDLQSFAASVEDTSSKDILNLARESSLDLNKDEDPEDLGFLSFLKEIDAIPRPPEEEEQKLPPPPPSPPVTLPEDASPPPPPPPPPPLEASDSEAVKKSNIMEITSRDVRTIHSRLYHISLLPSASIDQKDLERRLLEFAIRMLDWERGGLYDPYFLGKERAEALTSPLHLVETTEYPQSPPYGGIVGSMIKQMYELEQMAAPFGWMAVWDADDEAYGFQHTQTGTYSSVYPSQDLLHYLDPPSRSSSSLASSRSSNRSYFTSHAPASYTADLPSPTTSSAKQSPWNQATTSPLSSTSESKSHPNTPPTSSTTKTLSAKMKKRKAEGNMASSVADDNTFADQHIHPSRRAVLTSRSGATTPLALSASTGPSSKTMPKKLASLLQKWNEKDMEGSDEDEGEEDRAGGQDNGRQDPHVAAAAMTGSNSQSLGGDWRDRRLPPK